MENLADKGNGVYGYIDSKAEARRLLVQQLGATLITIAKDVKIQLDFNPVQVSSNERNRSVRKTLKQVASSVMCSPYSRLAVVVRIRLATKLGNCMPSGCFLARKRDP